MTPPQVPCVVSFRRSGVEVEVPPNQVLLEVAEEAGVALGSLCRGGTCGTCAARLLAGNPAIGSRHGLSAAQRMAGFVLTCSARTVAGQRIVLDL